MAAFYCLNNFSEFLTTYITFFKKNLSLMIKKIIKKKNQLSNKNSIPTFLVTLRTILWVLMIAKITWWLWFSDYFVAWKYVHRRKNVAYRSSTCYSWPKLEGHLEIFDLFSTMQVRKNFRVSRLKKKYVYSELSTNLCSMQKFV